MKKKIKFIYLLAAAVVASALIISYSQNVNQHKKAVAIPVADTTVNEENIGTVTGDDPWMELDKLVKTYYNENGMINKGKIRVIDGNGNEDKVLEEYSFEYTFAGDNDYYYTIGSLEVVSKKNFLLIADHPGKRIAITHHPGAQEKKSLFSIADFRDLVTRQQGHIQVTRLENQKMITIDDLKDPRIQGYRLYYDPNTYRLRKILVGMERLSALTDDTNEGSLTTSEKNINGNKDVSTDSTATGIEPYVYYIEMNYSQVEALHINKEEFHPELKFIKGNKGHEELMPDYRTYELLNDN